MVDEAESFEPVAVVAAWDETPALRGLRLTLPAHRASLHTAPGQVVKVRAGDAVGYFALASAPGAGTVELLVKRGGAVADALIAQAAPGATVSVSGPSGRGFPVDAAHGKDVLLFAAGSGITPVRSVVQHILAHRAQFGGAALFYGHRGHDEFAYTNEHAAWDQGGVKVVLCSSQAPDGWNGHRGYVQDVAHALGFLALAPENAVAYLCGMKGMVAGVKDVLGRAGVAPDRIFLNY